MIGYTPRGGNPKVKLNRSQRCELTKGTALDAVPFVNSMVLINCCQIDRVELELFVMMMNIGEVNAPHHC